MNHSVRRSTYVPFRRFYGCVVRQIMQRLSIAIHGTLGSFLRDVLWDDNVDVVACLLVPRAWARGVFLSSLLFL
jgi:hypothetical protein